MGAISHHSHSTAREDAATNYVDNIGAGSAGEEDSHDGSIASKVGRAGVGVDDDIDAEDDELGE